MKNFCFIGLFFILFTGFTFLALADENDARDWKSFSGKPIVTGKFEKFKPSNPEYVYLRSTNGKLYQYPFSKLSKEDQDFIKSLEEEDSDLVEVDETSNEETAAKHSGARGNDKSSSSATQEKQGKRYALLVGVNEYEDKSLEPLQYAVADIQLISEKLMQLGFEPEDIKMYISGNKVGSYPNKKTIEAGFREILEEADEDAQIFIAFAGHGFAFDKDSYFVVEDTKLDSDDHIKSTSINIKKFLDDLNNSKAASKWFIVDACREYITKNRSISNKNFSRGISSGIDKAKLPKGVFFLQSCSDGEFSYEDDGHGLFTRCFAEALDGKADLDNDKNMTVLEVFKYVSNSVKKNARNYLGKNQTPTFSTGQNSPDFIIGCTEDMLQYGLTNKEWDNVQKLYDEGVELLKQKNREEALVKFDSALDLMKNADNDAPVKQKITTVSEDIREGLKRDKQLEELQKAQNETKEKLLQAENQALMKRLEEVEARTKAAEEAAKKAQEMEKAKTTVVKEKPVYRPPTQFVFLGRVRSVQGDNSEARAMAAAYGYRLPSPNELAAINRSDISGIPADGWIETSNPYIVCDIFFQQLNPTQKMGTGMNLVVGCR